MQILFLTIVQIPLYVSSFFRVFFLLHLFSFRLFRLHYNTSPAKFYADLPSLFVLIQKRGDFDEQLNHSFIDDSHLCLSLWLNTNIVPHALRVFLLCLGKTIYIKSLNVHISYRVWKKCYVSFFIWFAFESLVCNPNQPRNCVHFQVFVYFFRVLIVCLGNSGYCFRMLCLCIYCFCNPQSRLLCVWI